jgi:hypothetical protein
MRLDENRAISKAPQRPPSQVDGLQVSVNADENPIGLTGA